MRPRIRLNVPTGAHRGPKIGFPSSTHAFRVDLEGQNRVLRTRKTLKNCSDMRPRAKSVFVHPSHDFDRFC